MFRKPNTPQICSALVAFVLAFGLALTKPAQAQSWTPAYVGYGAGCSIVNGSGQCISAVAACSASANYAFKVAAAYGQTGPYYTLQPRYASANEPFYCTVRCDYFCGGPLYVACPPGQHVVPYSGGQCASPATMNPERFGEICPLPMTTSSKTSSGSPPGGSCPVQISATGEAKVAEPVDVATGNMFYAATDYATAGQNMLRFTRYYNSRDTGINLLGVNWRTNFDRTVTVNGGSQVVLQRASGPYFIVNRVGGLWTTNSDIPLSLVGSGSSWTITDHDDTVEVYSGSTSQLTSITTRNGYKQTLSYNSEGKLATVTDSYHRTLTFNYNDEGRMTSLQTPDGTTITYGYSDSDSGQNLTSVTYPTSPATSLTYVYENTAVPNALTGVIDENGNRFLSWTYDQYARALTSRSGDANAGLTTLAYDDTTGERTVTNALGVVDTYTFTTLQSVPKVTGISRAATSGTAAASRAFTYDANGYMASATDWNSHLTSWVNDASGDPVTVNEAVGTPVARTTTIAYDPVWVHLPATIATPGLTATFTYDTSGEVLTQTLTDATTTSSPYKTAGEARTWTNTWSNLLLASVKTPAGNETSFGYDASGALTSITDALSHITSITAHTGGGLPETVVDPNGVTTTLTYNPRQWLTGSTVGGPDGTYATAYAYDATGNLTRTTLPDGSYLAEGYDAAHRLINVTNALGEYASYTLDALGDRTATNIYDSGGTLTRTDSGAFDNLGRLLVNTAGAGQTTTNTYDPEGNVLSATDGLSHTTKSAFDALNRMTKITDASGGVTSMTYDAHDRPLTVTDANSHTTAYVYDGFGDLIEQTSPDSGVTVFHFDADGNLSQKVDAAGVVTNHTYDALDRILTTTYPADPAENVAFTYDQPGHGFGIGRLTGMTDQMGSLSRSYDERGNLLLETRSGGALTVRTGYTYDAASRIASITYPSGTVVNYSRDAAGQVTKVGTSSSAVAAGITHLPFGPVNGFTFGNGIADTRSFDLDYRMIGILDKASGATATQSLVYAYDLANNLTSITDSVRPYLSQAFGYDVLNRLTSAAASDYGSFAWSYDHLGNRLTESRGTGSLITTYGYAPTSNQLTSISLGGVLQQTFDYTPTGNLTSVYVGTSEVAGAYYNSANRLEAPSGYGQILAEYGYDGFGQRLGKFIPGTKPTGALFGYAQDGSLLEETDFAARKANYIYLDGMPIGDVALATHTLSYLHTDHLGTPQIATDGSGTPVWGAAYYPFGGTSYLAGTITQNLRLPGQYFDAETQSYHNGWRNYAPGFGRYEETDPVGLGGGLNTYSYVWANPSEYTDRRGTESDGSLVSSLLSEGFESMEERGLSRLIYKNTNVFQSDADDYAKVCIGTQKYLLEAGLDADPYALILALLWNETKDAIREKVKDTVLNDPDIQSTVNTMNNNRLSLGNTIRTWISDHSPFGTVSSTLQRY